MCCWGFLPAFVHRIYDSCLKSNLNQLNVCCRRIGSTSNWTSAAVSTLHKPLGLTRHTKRSPQASGVLLALFEFHPANPDDLTDQKQPRPHQVAAAQILEAQFKLLHQCEDSEKLKSMLKRRELQYCASLGQ